MTIILFCVILFVSGKKRYKMNKAEFLKKLGFPEGMPTDNVHFVPVGNSPMDNLKMNLIESLKIPSGIDPMDVFITLMNADIQIVKGVGTNSLNLSFQDNVDPKIIEIIRQAVNDKLQLNQHGRVRFSVVDKDDKVFSTDGDSAMRNFAEISRHVLSEYPNCYAKIHGDLNLRDYTRKDLEKFDVSCLASVIVGGDFYPSKFSKVFPYRVVGTFDCHGLGKNYLTSGVSLPITPKINCVNSIENYDVLMDILPQGLETLIVEPKLVRESFVKENFISVEAFIKKYPNVKVIGRNGIYLSDVYNAIKSGNNNASIETPQIVSEPVRPARKTEVNTGVEQRKLGTHLTVNDLRKYCRTIHINGVYKYQDFSDADLRNLIKEVLKKYTNLKTKQKKAMENGELVDCIDFSEFTLFVKNLDDFIEKYKEKKTESQQQVKEPVRKKKQVTKPQSVGRTPMDIKKYITRNQFDEIAKSVKPDVALQLLHDVQDINLNPLDLRSNGTVPIVKNGTEISAPNITKYGGCCLRQKIKSKSIIWHVANNENGGVILVCVGFSTNSDKMKELVSQALKLKMYTAAELDSRGYIDVKTIIDGGNSGNGNSDTDVDLSFLNGGILNQKKADMSHPGR